MNLMIDNDGKAIDIDACSINIVFETEEEADRIREGLSKGLIQMMEWHLVRYKEPTKDDLLYCEERGLYIPDFVYVGIPDEEKEVIVLTKYGSVVLDEFVWDCDGCCGFENYSDKGEVIAWMDLPKGFKKEEQE